MCEMHFTHSSILAWEILWTEEPGGLQSMGSQKSRTRLSDYHFFFLVLSAHSGALQGFGNKCCMGRLAPSPRTDAVM